MFEYLVKQLYKKMNLNMIKKKDFEIASQIKSLTNNESYIFYGFGI